MIQKLEYKLPSAGAIQFRWHGGAFYEFYLPNGKTVITDPYQFGSKRLYVTDPAKHAHEVIDGCDYILLTHTHFDHAQDLPEMVQAFPKSTVILADDAYLSLMLKQGHNPILSALQPVGHKDMLELPDFILEAIRGKHTVISVDDPVCKAMPEFFTQGVPCDQQERYYSKSGIFDLVTAMFDVEAGMAFRNYILTMPQDYKILIWGGELSTDYRKNLYKGLKPDVMFVQLAATNVGGDREHPTVDTLAEFTAQVGAAVVLPLHQENFKWDMLEAIAAQFNSYYKANNLPIHYHNILPDTWYLM